MKLNLNVEYEMLFDVVPLKISPEVNIQFDLFLIVVMAVILPTLRLTIFGTLDLSAAIVYLSFTF